MTRGTGAFKSLAAAALVTLTLAACGSSGDSSTAVADTAGQSTQAEAPAAASAAAPAPAEGTVVDVVVGESDVQHQYMNLDTSSVPAGPVSFSITNEGVKTHEFVILSTDVSAAKLKMNGDGVNEDAYTAVDEVEDLAGGATATLDVNLKPGHYALICNVKGHYRMGMYTDLTVS